MATVNLQGSPWHCVKYFHDDGDVRAFVVLARSGSDTRCGIQYVEGSAHIHVERARGYSWQRFLEVCADPAGEIVIDDDLTDIMLQELVGGVRSDQTGAADQHEFFGPDIRAPYN